nr:jerky protein homolog-like [Aedes albopictus]
MDGSSGSSSKMNPKRKLRTLTLVEKVRIDVCSLWHGVNNRRTLKEQTFPLLEEALYVWILQQRQSNILLTVDIVKTKADLLFKMLQERGHYVVHKFSASDGWMHRFKQRFGLRLLATRSVITSTETVASGRKQNKTRYTFMPCSNIDGTLKLPLLFIGTAAKPRGLNIKTLPVSYCHSKKAWMTRQLFRHWFHDEFIPSVRKFSVEHGLEPKALLVLDNCTSHYDYEDPLQSDDGLIQVIYLPPNVTSECQPMDQSVINVVKRKYKRKLMLKLILENEDLKFEDRLKKINLQQCIAWLAAAWDEISTKTIRNSWRKLIDNLPNDATDGDATADTEDIKTLVASIDHLAGTTTSDEDIDLWMKDQVYDADYNAEWVTSEVFTDEEILLSVLHKDQQYLPEEWLEEPKDEGNSSLDTSNNPEGPDFNDAVKSLDCVIRFMKHDAAEVCRLNALRTKMVEAEWLKRIC